MIYRVLAASGARQPKKNRVNTRGGVVGQRCGGQVRLIAPNGSDKQKTNQFLVDTRSENLCAGPALSLLQLDTWTPSAW
jgi:hypothetical protein